MIIENNECLVDRSWQRVVQSRTIAKKNDPVTQKSALNDLNFKPKSTLHTKHFMFFKRFIYLFVRV